MAAAERIEKIAVVNFIAFFCEGRGGFMATIGKAKASVESECGERVKT